MRTNKTYSEFIRRFSGKTKTNFPISRLTTFKIGGLADVVAEADSREKLIEILRLIRELGLRYFVVAGGSNLLFSDKGFRGVLVHYLADDLKAGKRMVTVDAGYNLPRLVRDLAKQGIGGIDFLGNVPGSIGGAVVGNAGCYGKWVGDYVLSAEVFDMKTGRVKTMLPKQFKFGYRESICKQKPELIVMSVKLKVKPAQRQQVLKVVEAELAERHRKHPRQPSAGSCFKNINGQATWKLIDAAGLRGKRIGGAQISTKHPNFIVNVGKAKAKDVKGLVELVKRTIKQSQKITLETEVRLVDEKGVVS